jgi:TonB-linked SusC/RagA family outer membrane protein
MRKIHLQMKGLALLLFFICLTVLGQSQTVIGSVKDADKKTPVGGVTVKVVGASAATQTDEKGNFTVKATAGQALLISSVGYESQRITVVAGKPVVVSLKSQSTELEEVTVAMDIKKNPKELGASSQTVKGDDVKETQRENFLNGLQGRIAGATITSTSGVPGASATIVLRGFNSMSLDNQPLFVVDGIIMDNSTIDATANVAAAAGQSNTSNDFTNRIADLNPNDIETYTVLKGPEATVLYGSSASNGAIVITTKKAKVTGKQKVKVSYDNSFRLQSLQKLPSTFNGFQQGLNGVASGTFSAFGPKMDPDTKIYDNVGNFFKTSLGQTHNISVDFGSQKSSFRFSGSYYDQTGVVPNTRLTRTTFRLTNTTKIGKYIDITPSLTYTRSDNDKALKGTGGYLLNLFLWPVTDDAQVYLLKNGNKRFLLASNNDLPDAPLSGSSEIDNPFFAVNRNESKDKTDNYGANLAINITPYKWLTLSGRFGYNYYTTEGFQYRDPESASQSSIANKGQLDNYWTKQANYNHTITATVKKNVGKFNLRFTVGTRWNSVKRELYSVSGTRDSTRSYDSSSTGITTRSRLSRAVLVGPNEWNLYNTVQVAGFGEATIGYNNMIFLTGSLAFESSSILPKANRNYSYPGGSLSIIMSDIFPTLKGGLLNYWKLRASLASTARLPSPYANQSNFVPTVTSAAVAVPVQYAFTNANPYLMPERQNTYEIGTEAKLFDNKVSVDMAYYNTLALDQIAQGFRASYGTGFVLNTANNSSVRNQGIEISIGYQIMKQKDFDWNIQFNFNHMWSKVLAIPASIDISGGDYYDASTWLYNNARGGLRKGYSTGTITGFSYKRQDLQPLGANGVPSNDGAILISPTTGLPINEGRFRIIGDRTVRVTLGTINKFRYKSWNLSFLWDLRIGGDIFNATNMYLTSLGKSAKTSDRLTPRVIKGVLQNGLENTSTPTPNSIAVTPFYNNLYYSTTNMPEEDYIERSINAFRLRDISVSYSMPKEVLSRYVRAFKSMSFFLTCNDLILFTNYSGADPASNGGNASLRGVGAVGFDYGNIAAPLSFNAGLRIGF